MEGVNQDLINSTAKTPKFTITGSYAAKVVKVYDGDTFWAVFNFNNGLHRFICRMAGYNSAEIRGGSDEEKAKAIESKEALTKLIMNKIVKLDVNGFDKYGRILVKTFIDDIDVNKYMLDNNYGKPYNGAGEKKW